MAELNERRGGQAYERAPTSDCSVYCLDVMSLVIENVRIMTCGMKLILNLCLLIFGRCFGEETSELPDNVDYIPYGTLPALIWWTENIFPHDKKESLTHTIECSEGQCLTTVDKKLRNNSISQAFLFYGTDFRANNLPLPRYPWQHWALFHEESPKNNWILSHEDCIRLFNHTATFSPNSDYPVTSQFIKDPKEWTERTLLTTIEKNRLQHEQDLAPIAYVQRDCNPPSDRDSYVKGLMKYIRIDSYGPCLNNKKFPPGNMDGFHNFESEDFHRLLSKYKFNLAFENAICNGYMTEKLFRPLKVGSVPVYFGSPSVLDWMPNERSVVLVSDFSGPKELARYLNDLNDDDYSYESYLVHRKQGGIYNKALLAAIEQRPWKVLGEWDKMNFGHRMYAGYECYVCDQLYKWNNSVAEHLENPNIVPPPPATFADNSHLGCPEPKSSVASASVHYPQSGPYWQGLHEANALYEMVTNEESDSRKFIGQYLKMSTDKYTVPKDEL